MGVLGIEPLHPQALQPQIGRIGGLHEAALQPQHGGAHFGCGAQVVLGCGIAHPEARQQGGGGVGFAGFGAAVEGGGMGLESRFLLVEGKQGLYLLAHLAHGDRPRQGGCGHSVGRSGSQQQRHPCRSRAHQGMAPQPVTRLGCSLRQGPGDAGQTCRGHGGNGSLGGDVGSRGGGGRRNAGRNGNGQLIGQGHTHRRQWHAGRDIRGLHGKRLPGPDSVTCTPVAGARRAGQKRGMGHPHRLSHGRSAGKCSGTQRAGSTPPGPMAKA